MPQTAFITGATSGIGRALAYEMAGRGYGLALTARRMDILEEIKADLKNRYPNLPVSVRRLDVTDPAAVANIWQELTEELGGLDIVIANAGVALGEKVGAGEFAKFRTTIEVNLLGVMAVVDVAATYFSKRGNGHIVGISSVAAFRGMPRSSAYSASKAGVAVFLEAVRAELYKKKIDVTVLYPGFIDTPLNNMLPSRPFLISVERGASIIADLIAKKVKSSTVPVYPWNIVGRLLRILPTRVIAGM